MEPALSQSEEAQRSEIGRQCPEPARRPESPKRKGPRSIVSIHLGSKIDAANQKSREQEEEIDPNTKRIQRGNAMREEHHRDRDGARKV